MGFIKAIGDSFVGQYQDQFREIIKCDNLNGDVLLKKVTTSNGVIQNQSRLFVQPGQCAIFSDNGAIKDIISEPGLYFMDTSAPTLFQTNIFAGIGGTFLETIKRIAYEGNVINQQCVYFISISEKIGLSYTTVKPILYNDPEWGPIEISAAGQYAIKVNNPVNLLTNVTGDVNEYYTSQITNAILPYILSVISAEISKLGKSFDTITKEQDILAANASEVINERVDDLGIEVTRIVVSSIDVNDEVKDAMRQRVAIRMKATSVNSEQADIYAKLNQAEAIKDLANNPTNAGSSIMGMKVGDMFAGSINDSFNGSQNNQ